MKLKSPRFSLHTPGRLLSAGLIAVMLCALETGCKKRGPTCKTGSKVIENCVVEPPDGETQCEQSYLKTPSTLYSTRNDVTALLERTTALGNELWVGTSAGLVLLDGNSGAFKQSWTKGSDMPAGDPSKMQLAFPGQVVHSLVTDQSGALWVGLTGGAARIVADQAGRYHVERSFSRWGQNAGVSFDRIRSLIAVGKTVLGVAETGYSFAPDTTQLVRYDEKQALFVAVTGKSEADNKVLTESWIKELVKDPNDAHGVWLGLRKLGYRAPLKGKNGLLYLDTESGVTTLYDKAPDRILPRDWPVEKIVTDAQGLWLLSYNQLYFFKFADHAITSYANQTNDQIEDITPSAHGLYVKTTLALNHSVTVFYRFDGGHLKAVTFKDPATQETPNVRHLFASATGQSLLAFTYDLKPGAYFYENPKILRFGSDTAQSAATDYRFKEGSAPWLSNVVKDIKIDTRGVKWLAIANQVVSLNGEEWRSYTLPFAVEATALAIQEKEGRTDVWVAADGLYHLENDQFVHKALLAPADFEGDWGEAIIRLTFDTHGTLWMAGYKGLGRYDGTTFKLYTAKNSGTDIAKRQALVPVYIQNDQVWTAENCGRIYRLDIPSGQFRVYSGEQEPHVCAHAITGDGKERIYVGSTAPAMLVTLEKGEVTQTLKEEEGATGETIGDVNELKVAPDGTLWIATGNNGLQFLKDGALLPAIHANNSFLTTNIPSQLAFEKGNTGFQTWVTSNLGLQALASPEFTNRCAMP